MQARVGGRDDIRKFVIAFSELRLGTACSQERKSKIV